MKSWKTFGKKSWKTFGKVWCTILVLLLSVLLSAPNCLAGKTTLKIAQVLYPKPSAHMDSIERMAKQIKDGTNGKFKIMTYGPELCDWAELNEMVMRGNIDLALVPLSSSFDPRWNAVWAPYIVSTYDEAKDVFGPSSSLQSMFDEWAQDMGVVWLGTWLQGFAGVSLSKAGATTPEEAKGIKIRVPPIAAFECYWKALGFIPTLIPYSEVPTAISTGVVDGQAGGGPFQTWSCCRDLNKYFVYYRDYMEIWGYIYNKAKWDKLSAVERKLIQDIVNNEVALRMAGAEAEDTMYMKKLEAHGLKVIDLADYPDKLKAARDTARQCWTKMDETVGKVWMDRIRKAVGMPTK